MSVLSNRLRLYCGRFITHSVVTQSTKVANRRCLNTSANSRNSILKLGFVGVSVGALIGTGYSIRQRNKPNSHIMNEQTTIPLVHKVPDIKPSRNVRLNECTMLGAVVTIDFSG